MFNSTHAILTKNIKKSETTGLEGDFNFPVLKTAHHITVTPKNKISFIIIQANLGM